MVWQGKTNPEIAAVLGSTEQVVKNQLRSVFDKLGVWSRLELALYVSSHGGAAWADAIRQQATGTDGPLVSAVGLIKDGSFALRLADYDTPEAGAVRAISPQQFGKTVAKGCRIGFRETGTCRKQSGNNSGN
jgi:hypothetical protein